MKIRPAGSMQSLDDSMERVSAVANWDQLMAYLRLEFGFWSPTDDNVTVKPYCHDTRIDWDTYLVCIDGKAALFSDGPMERPSDRVSAKP